MIEVCWAGVMAWYADRRQSKFDPCCRCWLFWLQKTGILAPSRSHSLHGGSTEIDSRGQFCVGANPFNLNVRHGLLSRDHNLDQFKPRRCHKDPICYIFNSCLRTVFGGWRANQCHGAVGGGGAQCGVCLAGGLCGAGCQRSGRRRAGDTRGAVNRRCGAGRTPWAAPCCTASG